MRLIKFNDATPTGSASRWGIDTRGARITAAPGFGMLRLQRNGPGVQESALLNLRRPRLVVTIGVGARTSRC